jgi:hypothetical protein
MNLQPVLRLLATLRQQLSSLSLKALLQLIQLLSVEENFILLFFLKRQKKLLPKKKASQET